MSSRVLVLGTHNRKKRAELEVLLAPLGFELHILADYPNALEVEETGETFAVNAALKAVEQAKHLKRWVLGEDSGLAVDALQGAPGVYSARYSGPQATDESNNQKLLADLQGVPWEKRSAHYVCQLALSDPSGQLRAERQATCRGRIRTEPSGEGGFGYDPLFEIVEYHRTFGEMGGAFKAAVSHRARAIREFLPLVRALAPVWNEV